MLYFVQAFEWHWNNPADETAQQAPYIPECEPGQNGFEAKQCKTVWNDKRDGYPAFFNHKLFLIYFFYQCLKLKDKKAKQTVNHFAPFPTNASAWTSAAMNFLGLGLNRWRPINLIVLMRLGTRSTWCGERVNLARGLKRLMHSWQRKSSISPNYREVCVFFFLDKTLTREKSHEDLNDDILNLSLKTGNVSCLVPECYHLDCVFATHYNR